MNLILLLEWEVICGIVNLPADDRRACHIIAVLKPELGTLLRVGVINGCIGKARVTSIGDDGGVSLEVVSLNTLPQVPRIELILAAPRPKVLKRLWKPMAEVGLRRIFLVNACRVEKAYMGPQNADHNKYLPELLRGLEQSAVDTYLPEVSVEKNFRFFVENKLDGLCPQSEVLRLVCDLGESVRVAEAVALAPPGVKRVIVAIGPEGGWVDKEVELLNMHGFHNVSLGSRVLTTETALLSLVALASDAFHAKIGAVPDGSLVSMLEDAKGRAGGSDMAKALEKALRFSKQSPKKVMPCAAGSRPDGDST